MSLQHESENGLKRSTHVHDLLGRTFEMAQDLIVATLCVILLVIMAYGLWILARLALLQGTNVPLVLSQVVLLLILIELFRTMIFYLREHRVSVPLMLEVAMVSELREVLLKSLSSTATEQYLGNGLILLVLGALWLAVRYVSVERPVVGKFSLKDDRGARQ
jgi:uncharacterized membrane protein (DUF373 family)